MLCITIAHAQPQPAAPELAFPGDTAAAPNAASPLRHTEPTILRPAVCTDGDGDFVVAWVTKPAQSGLAPGDVYFQTIDRTGTIGPSRVQANASAPGIGTEVACSADGSFTIVWTTDYTSPPDDPGDIYARRFDADGIPYGSEFLVNTTVAGEQHTPSICSDAAGNFVVAWLTPSATADVDLVVRRFDSAGAPLTGEILVRSLEDARSPDERSVSLACDPSGNFVLAWIERSASITWNVWAQRFDSNAVPLAAEFLVSNVVGDNLPSQVDVAVNASGAFAVAWNTFIGYLRQYDASGAPVSPPSYLQLDGGVGCMGAPSVAIDASGRVLVISGCGGSDGQPDGSGVIAWEFDAAGAPLADAARVNTSRLGDQRFPVAAIAPDGDFLVVWTNAEPEPRVLGGQFFCDPADAECDICPGHDDSADADGDGIPDGCDPCTNVDGGSGSGQPAKLVLRRLETPGWPFGQSSSRASLKLVADFTTAAPAAFSSIDPVADGIHVLVSASDGGSVVDAHLPAGAYTPGGAGWRSNRTGTKWFYRDKTATPTRGIVKAVLIDRGDKAGPGSVRAKVRGKRSIYPAMTTSDPPMSLTVVLGDDTGALAGSCGQSGFTGAQCEANLDHPAISCRK